MIITKRQPVSVGEMLIEKFSDGRQPPNDQGNWGVKETGVEPWWNAASYGMSLKIRPFLAYTLKFQAFTMVRPYSPKMILNLSL